MPWIKGQSGNPKGRPPKERALTSILEKAGSKTLEYEGKRISSKRLVARLVWSGSTTGKLAFPDGNTIELTYDDWIELVKFIYQHIDGPPKAELDVTSGGERLIIQYVNDWRDQATVPASGSDGDPAPG
jgi:hypothetical protein